MSPADGPLSRACIAGGLRTPIAHRGGALSRILPEDLGQANGRNHFADQNVAEHDARADAGQLIRVADHEEPRAGNERAQQRTHQKNIHHGHFVNNNNICFQWILRITIKMNRSSILFSFRKSIQFQKSVNGLRLIAGGFCHSFCSTAGRCRKTQLCPFFFKIPDYCVDSGCFSGSRNSRKNK